MPLDLDVRCLCCCSYNALERWFNACREQVRHEVIFVQGRTLSYERSLSAALKDADGNCIKARDMRRIFLALFPCKEACVE